MNLARISVIIPIFNESGNILSLDSELKSVLQKMGNPYEIIYVNDDSDDSSLEELQSLTGVTILTMNRRYGQATALDAGFKAATGELIVSMDGDGQNDPADIPLLIKKLYADKLDVVAGWRKVRSDKQGIRILTRIGRALRRFLISDTVHDTGCTLRVYKAKAAKSLDIGGEMHRYILALLRWKGYRIGEIVVTDRKRMHGVSKYNYSKAVRGFIDLLYIWFIYKYSQRPIHLFGYLSICAFFISVVSFMLTVYDRIFTATHLNRDGWFFLSSFSFLAAIILFTFGILIDLSIRTYLNTSSSEKRYYIRDEEKT